MTASEAGPFSFRLHAASVEDFPFLDDATLVKAVDDRRGQPHIPSSRGNVAERLVWWSADMITGGNPVFMSRRRFGNAVANWASRAIYVA
jgi:hypothetical protein